MFRRLLLSAILILSQQARIPGPGGYKPSSGTLGPGATCTGHVAAGDVTCIFSPSLSSGSILIIGWAAAGPPTGFTVTGCGASWASDTFSQDANRSIGTGASSGACTVTIHVTAGTDSQKDVAGLEVKSSSGIDDSAHGAIADQGFIATPNTISSPSLTTTVSNALVIGIVVDYNGNGTTFTAGSPATIAVQTSQATNVNVAIESYTKATAGATQPTFTYNSNSSFATASAAFKP